MSGVLDFLFEGKPPAAVNTYGTTVENVPKWMSDYTQGLIGRANVIAAEPYQAYEGPRIAGFAPDQLQAFGDIRENQGSWKPGMDYAGSMVNQGGGLAQAGAQNFTGNAVNDYMDPYIGNVLNRQQELSNRNLNENVLPGIQSAFIGSGTFGSDRMADIATRAGRDISEGLQGQQLGALSQAYGQAGELFGADRSRELQAGQLSGALAGEAGALSEAQQGMEGRDAAALAAVGSEQQQMGQSSLDLAYNDFQRQQNYPQDQVNWMSEIIRGLPHSTATQTTETGPASSYGASPLSQIGSLYSLYQGTKES